MAAHILGRTLAHASFTTALADDAFVRAMLRFEGALAESQAAAGVIPMDAARAIAAVCGSLIPSDERLASGARASGSLAVPLVAALTEEVRRRDPPAAAFVHYGSTSQDVLDTALVLGLRPCLDEVDRVLAGSVARLADHARRHAATVMLGRTLMQPATPITAGLKIARWAGALDRCRIRLGAARERALCVQLGGAVGTLDALGARRVEVRRGVAERLGLADSNPWHAHRDELLRLFTELSIMTVAVGKIARDITLLSQPEIGEMLESPPRKGVGGSSAMPHKRNPVACLQAIASATRAPGLVATMLHGAMGEHERALGGWQAALATIPELIPIQIREGVNSGEVVVRSIESDLRMDYSAVGQTAHLAARMEQAAMPGSTVLSPYTLWLVEDHVQVTSLGPTAIKGRPSPLEIFELTGIAGGRTRLHAAAARGLTRFVGRTDRGGLGPRSLRARHRHASWLSRESCVGAVAARRTCHDRQR